MLVSGKVEKCKVSDVSQIFIFLSFFSFQQPRKLGEDAKSDEIHEQIKLWLTLSKDDNFYADSDNKSLMIF